MGSRLVWNWRRVLRYSWSVRLIVLAGILSGAEVLVPLLDDVIPRGLFALLSVITTIAAAIARLVAQKSISGGE